MRTQILLLNVALSVALGCGDPALHVEVPLAVVNVAPHDGAIGIEWAAVPTVCFNLEMEAAATAGLLALEKEGGVAAGGLVVVATADPACLALEHAPFDPDTTYRISIGKGLKARGGEVLVVDVVSSFRTAR